MSKTKQNTGKGAAKLAKSSTEGLRSTAAAAPKPAKKPTTGERIAADGAHRLRFDVQYSYQSRIDSIARLIDRAIAEARKEAAWSAYYMAFNGVLPDGIEFIYGKRRKKKGRKDE